MHLLSLGQSLGLVVLPETTPSPTPRRELYDAGPPAPSAKAVMFGLQAAQAEGVAHERLRALQALEAELDAARAAAAAATDEVRVHRAAEAVRKQERHAHRAGDPERVATLKAELAAAHATRAPDAPTPALSPTPALAASITPTLRSRTLDLAAARLRC
jgi:hypothetical protein